MVASIDQSSLREDVLTPHKKQKRVVKSLSDNKLDFDFNDEVLVESIDPLSFSSSWPSLLERLELLTQAVVFCCVVSCRVVLRCVVSCHVMSCHVMSCRVVSCRVVSYRVVSCFAVL